jgi:DAK2 domain fusion protein YloV
LKLQIDGEAFRNMIVSAAHNIENNKQSVNELNVFPVPDGDTGTNMSLTMSAAAKTLSKEHGGPVGEIAEKTANALLRGARGNSGVILSLLFRGIARSLKGKTEINGNDLALALKSGVEMAYKAVMKPTEGTILTVARLSSDMAASLMDKGLGLEEMLEKVIESANDALKRTPDMLHVLKQAGVVDAGGKGLVLIYEGAYSYLKNGSIIQLAAGEDKQKEKADFAALNTEDIKFSYCTEFIIIKSEGAGQGQSDRLRRYLESIGDSVVVVEDDEIIKVHVHTNNPGNAIERAITISPITNIKIDNMKQQHNDLQSESETELQQENEEASVPNKEESIGLKEYGFVAVSCGKGLSEIFRDIGADTIAEGGQTMNPSTEDILNAVNRTAARTVFVLPNNKNIIMAAEQASRIVEGKNIVVIPTKTIPQGICAMLNFNETESLQANINAMEDSLYTVKTAQVTVAARDSSFDGMEIKQGQFMGLNENKVTIVDEDIFDVTECLILSMVDKGSSMLTVYCGSDVSKEDRKTMEDRLTAAFSKLEISFLDGGQPIYHYIISIE